MAEPRILFICVIAGVRKLQRLREREKIAITPEAKHTVEAMLLTVQAVDSKRNNSIGGFNKCPKTTSVYIQVTNQVMLL